MKDWRQKILLRFSDRPQDVWTVDDAVRGTSIYGATGSGKTTASGKTIAMQFLKQRWGDKKWGGIVLCAKSDEADLWEEYCKEAGRSADVIRFGKNAVHTRQTSEEHEGEIMVFNPLQYEMT